jgi:hypothetical protein
MSNLSQEVIRKAYDGLNNRKVDEVLVLMHPDVHWPNGWEGGYVEGQEAVREYWTRQCKEIDPHVSPVSIEEKPGGRFVTSVHQLVKYKNGALLMDSLGTHVYAIENGLITKMEIEQP